MKHEVSGAISLVPNPSFSKVSIKTCCAAFSGGAIIVDDAKALTPAWWKRVEEEMEGPPILPFFKVKLPPFTSRTSHSLTPAAPYKRYL
jgi:hypothetical protein